MNKPEDNPVLVAFMVGLLSGAMLFAALLLAADKSPKQITKAFQADAVRLGYAQWKAGPDSEPVFRWNKPEGCWSEKKKHSRPSD